MNEHDPKHFWSQVWIRSQCTADEVVDSSDRLYTRETTASNNKREQWLFYFAAVAIGFFQMGDEMIPQPHRVTQRFHGQRAFF